jgi:chromosome partitioning protein
VCQDVAIWAFWNNRAMSEKLYNGLKILDVFQRKGGVGKSFFTATIAYLLSHGGPDGKGIKRRVLVIDYDSQQDTSKAFLKMNAIPGDDEYAAPIHPNFGELNDPEWSGRNTSTDILFDLPVYEYPTAFEGIHVLPSEGNVDRVFAVSPESERLVSTITKHMEDWFSVKELAEDYDVVIVDNPPSKSPISAGLLGAATHVLIPTEPEYDSIDGVPMLLNRIERINETRYEHPLEVLAIIPNKVPSKSRMTQKDEIALTKLYDRNGPTSKHMSRFWVTLRNCYRVMERPSANETHFNYIYNHLAKDEMMKLYQLVESRLWGEENEHG